MIRKIIKEIKNLKENEFSMYANVNHLGPYIEIQVIKDGKWHYNIQIPSLKQGVKYLIIIKTAEQEIHITSDIFKDDIYYDLSIYQDNELVDSEEIDGNDFYELIDTIYFKLAEKQVKQ